MTKWQSGVGIMPIQKQAPRYYAMWNKGLDVDALLHPSVSHDGVNFTTRPTYNTYTPKAASGMAGDPTLMNYNSRMWVVMTPQVDFTITNNTLEIASSIDGDNWQWVCSPDFTSILGGAYNEIWNDAWFQDVSGLPYMFIDRAQTTNHVQEDIWLTQATNSELTAWTAPAQLTGTGFPSSIQSAYVILSGGTYYLFYKNVTNGFVEVASRSAPFGATGWTVIKTGDWAGWGSPREAQWFIQRGSEYRVYLDQNGTGYLYSDSTGGPIGTWSATKPVVTDFGTPQHGSVILNLTGH